MSLTLIAQMPAASDADPRQLVRPGDDAHGFAQPAFEPPHVSRPSASAANGLSSHPQDEARPEWFNLPARTLEIRETATFHPKDRDARTVPLTDQFADFLKQYGLHSPFVLKPEVPHGHIRYRYDFRRPFGEYMKAQGVDWLTPHIMRHSFASICASKGIDIYRTATWLGDDVRVVQRHYAKLRPDDREIMRAFKVVAAGTVAFGSASPAFKQSMQPSRSRRS